VAVVNICWQALSIGFNAMNTSCKAFIPKLISSGDVTSALATAVANACEGPVAASVAVSFQSTVVPSVERASQQMFKQLDQASAAAQPVSPSVGSLFCLLAPSWLAQCWLLPVSAPQ
jgi:hypothetical protein